MSAASHTGPPPLPLNATVVAPFLRAAIKPAMTLRDLPDVVSPIATSPRLAKPEICRAKT